jgi:hypothetical protein
MFDSFAYTVSLSVCDFRTSELKVNPLELCSESGTDVTTGLYTTDKKLHISFPFYLISNYLVWTLLVCCLGLFTLSAVDGWGPLGNMLVVRL